MITHLNIKNFRSIADSGNLELGPITVIVGANNSGKSSFLRALYQLQLGAPWSASDIRIGETETKIFVGYKNTDFRTGGGQEIPFNPGIVLVSRTANEPPALSAVPIGGGQEIRLEPITNMDPGNLIYPSLSGRHRFQIEEQVRLSSSQVVSYQDSSLVSRLSRFSNPKTPHGKEFSDLCLRILGVELNMLTAENGQSIGIQIDRNREIRLDNMGTGISTVLSLLLNLCDNERKLYLIEEPENDLHPKALKQLVDVLIEKSNLNQFVITTHSNVVLTKLGSQEGTSVIHASTDNNLPPTTTFKKLSGRHERLEALRDLGYELADLDLGEGWLIFEESTAERLCRDYLIPWFAPGLKRLNTVAGSGVSRIRPLVQNLCEILLFADLEPAYKYRAWVIADGDEVGIQAIKALKNDFKNWPPERFLNWQFEALESCFPSVFADDIEKIVGRDRGDRRELKRALFNKLLGWIEEDETRARTEFAKSAADVILVLKRIETASVL